MHELRCTLLVPNYPTRVENKQNSIMVLIYLTCGQLANTCFLSSITCPYFTVSFPMQNAKL